MLGKLRKMLKKQKGFTLIELMTVLIILGIVLGIGVPKYLQIQAKSEWEADESTIKNFAKAAEIYAASTNKFGEGVGIGKAVVEGATPERADGLIGNNLIEDVALNRINEGGESKKNEGNTTISAVTGVPDFTFNQDTGAVNNLGEVVNYLIGPPPYGPEPTYPGDSVVFSWGAPRTELP